MNVPHNGRLDRGFTLIEVMIVVAIVAILASIAVPAYTDYLRRGKLPEAFTYLSDYKVKMEQYYQDNRIYGTGTTCANVNPPPWNGFAPSGAKYFTFGCTSTGQSFTLTATSNAALGTSHKYTLNDANTKVTIDFKGATVNKSGCWLVSGNEC